MSDYGQLAVDAVFSIWGKAASYTPPGIGASVPCTVVLDAADRMLEMGQGCGVVQGRVIEVRAAELAAPVKSGSFQVGGNVYTVIEDPHHADNDPDRLVWRMRVS